MYLNKFQIILILVVTGLILPIWVNAFLDGPIVPCGTRASGRDCTLCDIFKMGQNIINFIWELIIVIVPIFILAGGIMILTAGAKPDQVGLGKKIIFNAIIGMVIAFLSWTIINMVFNTLVGEGKKEGFPWPWNEIQCKGGGVSEEEPIIKEGEYCVCEVPVYDLDPNTIPDASIIAKNVKTQMLSSQDECKKECVSANTNKYCSYTLKPDQANLYCASKTALQSKKACFVSFGNTQCQISIDCYNSEKECLDSASTKYKQRCFLNGTNICQCFKGNQKAVCENDPNKYTIFRIKSESPAGGDNFFNCSTSNENTPCRVNCQYYKCSTLIEENRCNLLSPAGSCFGGYACQKGVADQQGDASTELKSLLTCMTNKLPSDAKEISSISDNSGGRCFKEWNGQCSSGKDSCEGTCCGHSKCSLHYGGKARVDSGPADCGIGSIDCRMYSYAVDFANEQYFSEIKKAAGECAKQLWSGSLEDIDVIKEGDHIHVELEGIAKYHKCK